MSNNKIGGSVNNQNVQTFLNDTQYSNPQNRQTVKEPTVNPSDYIVKRGDTLTEIAVKTGRNLQQLIKDNPQIKNPNRIYVGQHVKTGGETAVYTVKRGDTLNEIAKRHKTEVGDILKANPGQIANRNLIYPGQKLHIPAAKLQVQTPPTKQPINKIPVPTKPAPTNKTPTPNVITPNTDNQVTKPNSPTNTAQVVSNSNYKSIDLDTFLDKNKGSNALAAIIIGNAEGNRTPNGGFTQSYQGHTDPGDKKHNLGSFSYNPRGSGQVANTPEEADKIYLGVLAGRRTSYEKAVKAAGLDPNNALLASTYFDASNQSPRAGDKMLAQLEYVKKNGITPETMKEWRFRGYVNHETGQRWAYQGRDGKTSLAGSGFKTVYASRHKGATPTEAQLQETIRTDQNRRLDAMVKALDAQGYKSNAAVVNQPPAPVNTEPANKAATGNYRIRPNVKLTDEAKSKLNLISQEYSKRTGGKIFEITSGTRTPQSQAGAMYTKILLGDDFSEYKNKKAVGEVLDACRQAKSANKSPEQIKAAMAQVIENQTKQGIYISRHLRGGAADVSLKGLDQKAFRESIKAVTGQEPLYEGKPPHYHFQF